MNEMNKINTLNIQLLPPNFNGGSVTPKNAQLFNSAVRYTEPLLKKVVSRFEDALREKAGIDEDALKGQEIREIALGAHEAVVTAIPKTTTKYAEVGKSLDTYLSTLDLLNKNELRRDGIVRFEGVPHIQVSEVQDKMESLLGEYKSTHVSYTIDKDGIEVVPRDLIGLLNITPSDMGRLTPRNAVSYAIAKDQLSLLKKKLITPFQNTLKGETGFSKEYLPSEVEVDTFEVGDHIFMVTSSTKETVKYGEAAKGFMQILEDAVENPGSVRVDAGRDFLSIDELVSDYRGLISENTTTSLDQKVDYFPQPKYNAVLAE